MKQWNNTFMHIQNKFNPMVKKLLYSSVFLLSTSAFYYAQDASIKGKIDSSDKQQFQDIEILAEGTNYTTKPDENGYFILPELPNNKNYLLIIRRSGYEDTKIPVEVSNAEKNLGNIHLIGDKISEIEGVQITTQKRLQNSYEVPITVSAVNGKLLDNLNLHQMDEMAAFIPGMQIQLQSPNNPGYVIRGITSDDGDSRSQPRVSVFQDGVSISRSRASVVELYDMERVEVAKGPQGTLFGRGAEIGAIHLIQNKPQKVFGAEINAGYGAYNNFFITGHLNTPFSEKLANRLAVYYETRDGFNANLSGGRLNGKGVFAIRNSTKLWANPNTEATLILNYQRDDYPGTSFKNNQYAPADGDTDPNTFADLEQGKNLYIKRDVGGGTLLIDHTFNDKWKLNSITGFRAFNSDESFDADGTAAPILWVSEIAKGTQLSQEFRFNYDDHNKFRGFLGASFFYENSTQEVPMRINQKALYTAYIAPLLTSQLTSQFGTLGTSLGLSSAQVQALQSQLEQIMVVPTIMTDGQVNMADNLPNLQPFAISLVNTLMGGTLPDGITWSQLVASGMLPSSIPDELIGLITVMDGSEIEEDHYETSINKGINSAYEIFADGTYDLTDNFKITAGLRGSYEYQKGGYYSPSSNPASIFGILLNDGSPNLLNPVSDEWIYASKDYFSYVGRIALNYLFNKNNIYASVSRGRRPGVITILPSETTYLKPEIVYSYEIGIKGIIARNKLSYEFNTYYYDWNHFQTSSYQVVEGTITPTYLSDDGGKAHTFGIETSLRYKIAPQIEIFGNYSYIDGKFNETDENGNAQEYAGNRFRLTPKNSFAMGIDANFRVSDNAAIYLRPNYNYKSGVYFEDDNREDLYQKGYGLMNFTAGYTFRVGKTHYDIGAFGKNIFDTKYIIDAGNSGDTIGFPTYVGGTRSIIGGQLKVTF